MKLYPFLTGILLGFAGLAAARPPDAQLANPDLIEFRGMCDASAVIPLTDDLFVVGDDEDNFLRVYSRRAGGLPVTSFNQSRFLGFKKSSGETDLEGAARIGDVIYWISSHGRNSKGKNQPKRQRLFATRVGLTNGEPILQPLGVHYANLLEDLANAPQLKVFNLGRAARRAPKSANALNIEGLAATPEGHLLIGFRNPVPDGKALLVPLLNPAEVVRGKSPQLGEPRQLELGGLGIRAITWWRDRYLIIAGASAVGGNSRLYEWSGIDNEIRLLDRKSFAGLNPEAIAPWPNQHGEEWVILSDDGAQLCDGVECKKLKDVTRKRFRALFLPALTDPATPPLSKPD